MKIITNLKNCTKNIFKILPTALILLIPNLIINCPSPVAADAPAIYLAGQQVPYSKSVKDLGLILHNAFSWENQVNLYGYILR
jgi:hypothetical protein